MSPLSSSWNYPTSVRFGAGKVAELPDICRSLGIQRPLLVTDAGIADTEMVRGAVVSTGAGLFAGVQPNPVAQNVEDGVGAFRAGGHDGVIAFGGGSSLDVGKSIAFMAAQTRPIWDFEDVGDNYLRANLDGIADTIAVPTTAGTGSEVGRCTVITNEATHTKKIIFHPRMMPAVAVLDPELTVGMPRQVTAGTAMDALAHNLEAYCATGYHPMADGIAVEGIRLIKESLPAVLTDAHDLDARANLLAAATMGATAFQKGLGAVHALSHPIGSIYGFHHGMLNGLFMPYVLAFNRPAVEDRVARLGAYLGLDRSFDALYDWLIDLRRLAGMPRTLSELGVDPARFAEMARMAEVDPPIFTNPVPMMAGDLEALYVRSYEG